MLKPARHHWLLIAIVLHALAIRCIALTAPLLDGMLVKQIYVAQRVRAIVEPPFHPLRSTFDILTPEGNRLEMIEEIPLYPTMVATVYAAVGEQECIGRIISLLATIIALVCVYDLSSQSFGRGPGLVAAFLFSLSPLTIFYGQAFQADAAMVAAMLLSTCAWRRFLETLQWRWWLAALAGAAVAACFKYFGLMVLASLAVMTWQQQGFRAKPIAAGLILAFLAMVPVGLWMLFVFGRSRTPADDGVYFIHQMPELLTSPMLYLRFLDRFLYKDCGIVLAIFALAGVATTLTRPARCGWLTGWTITGLLFYILLGPKLRYHDYYEFMMIPAACGWAAVAWQRINPRFKSAAFVLLAAGLILQSPWVASRLFDREEGLLRAAEMLARHTNASDRTILCGPSTQCAILHYARRECWLSDTIPTSDAVALHRRQGAKFLLIYINHELGVEQRQACEPLLKTWPIIERQDGLWSTKHRATTIILLDLRTP